jgi:hypothetical protein
VSKPRKAAGRGRMTPATIKTVVDEIAAYGRSEREEPLSWAALVRFSGFSRISLWAKPAIKDAFQKAQEALRTDATPTIKAPRTTDERVLAMQQTQEELRAIVRAYDERWALYEYNAHRLGLDPDELRRPLDPLVRGQVRARRVKMVR